MTPDEITNCQASLLYFMRHMFQARFGVPMKIAPFHEKICDALERVFIGECSRLLICLPPRSGKTEIAINFIAWSMGHYPEAQNLLTSYSKRLCTANAWKIREMMLHPDYREIFNPPPFCEDSAAKDEFRNTKGGCVYAAGTDGSLTGFGFGLMSPEFGGICLVDDPLKSVDRNSQIVRDNVNDWFLSTCKTRRNNPNAGICVIAQRLAPNDLPGFLLAGGSSEEWELLTIPALDENEQSFWPEQFPVDELLKMRASDPLNYAAQMQQNPIIPGGNIVKGEWFGKYIALPPQLEYRFITADTAMKTGDANDFSVFTLWGVKHPNIYGLDQLRGKWEAPDLRTQAAKFWRKHITADKVTMGALRAIYIEDKASGTGLIQDFRKDYGIPVVAIQRADKKDRYARLSDVLHYLSGGRVLFPDPRPAWALYTIAEAEAFTPNDSHDHDDTLDTLIDGINIALAQTSPADLWRNPALFK